MRTAAVGRMRSVRTFASCVITASAMPRPRYFSVSPAVITFNGNTASCTACAAAGWDGGRAELYWRVFQTTAMRTSRLTHASASIATRTRRADIAGAAAGCGGVVVARNAALAAGAACTATLGATDLNNGSFDPDPGDALSLAVLPAGPFGLGQHQVALSGADSHGASASAAAFVTVSDESGPSIGDIVVRREEHPSQRHGMTLVTIDYTAVDNCGAVATALSISGGSHDRAQVVDAHHVLVKRGHGDDDDDDEGRRLSLTIVATYDIGNQSHRRVTIGGRTKSR